MSKTMIPTTMTTNTKPTTMTTNTKPTTMTTNTKPKVNFVRQRGQTVSTLQH